MKRERILTFGITGSGKSYQWLKAAESLKPTGARFRCIDTDASITFMLEEQFPHLMPENGGNVYVYDAFDMPELKLAQMWALHRKIPEDKVKELVRDGYWDKYILEAYKEPLVPKDWVIVDMVDRAWEATKDYFVQEVFEDDIGDYFLQVRKIVRQQGEKTGTGRDISSLDKEALSGWVDWTVINKMYADWINPLVYRAPCHLYMATTVKEVSKQEKDTETLNLYGVYGYMPTGQKKLGHMVHSIILLIPRLDKKGNRSWRAITIKDRAGREYYNNDEFTSLYFQYLVGKGGWDLVLPE